MSRFSPTVLADEPGLGDALLQGVQGWQAERERRQRNAVQNAELTHLQTQDQLAQAQDSRQAQSFAEEMRQVARHRALEPIEDADTYAAAEDKGVFRGTATGPDQEQIAPDFYRDLTRSRETRDRAAATALDAQKHRETLEVETAKAAAAEALRIEQDKAAERRANIAAGATRDAARIGGQFRLDAARLEHTGSQSRETQAALTADRASLQTFNNGVNDALREQRSLGMSRPKPNEYSDGFAVDTAAFNGAKRSWDSTGKVLSAEVAQRTASRDSAAAEFAKRWTPAARAGAAPAGLSPAPAATSPAPAATTPAPAAAAPAAPPPSAQQQLMAEHTALSQKAQAAIDRGAPRAAVMQRYEEQRKAINAKYGIKE